jgi:CheY-like chemotaxis protein
MTQGVVDATVSAAPITILIVDDAQDMRLLARAYLEQAGFEVADEAIDGQEALAKYRALDPPPIPTVILLDNQMPKLTGIQAATQILADAPDQLIVLFSAYLDEAMIAEAKRLGVAGCVSKTDLRHLPSIIGEIVTASR